MKKCTAVVLCIIMLSLPFISLAFTDFDVVQEEKYALHKGVELKRYDLVDKNTGDLQSVFLIEVDRNENSALRLTTLYKNHVLHNAREKTTLLVKKEGKKLHGDIICAVNGDFFDMLQGGTLGAQIKEGRVIAGGMFNEGYCVGMLDNGEVRIDTPQLSFALTVKRKGEVLFQDVKIDGVNFARKDVERKKCAPQNAYDAYQNNELVLYTPDYYYNTHTEKGGTEVRFFTEDTLMPFTTVVGKAVYFSSNGHIKLTKNHMVLSAIGEKQKMLAQLQKGDEIEIHIAMNARFQGVQTLTGGGRPDFGPLLVQQGQKATSTAHLTEDKDYFYAYHPRNVVGTRKDHTYFFLFVEGNDVQSRGITIEQTKQLALDLNAEYAVNLDGGPSSTMVCYMHKRLKRLTVSEHVKNQVKVGNVLVLYQPD